MAPKPSEVAPQARIFKNERLHQLQVRYPWAGGYAVAPLFFHLGQAYGAGNFTWFSKVPTLLSLLGSSAGISCQAGIAQACWYVHFLRRLWEVFFVNDYSGNFERDSRGELLYYSLWGFIAGAAVGEAPLQLHGTVSRSWAAMGVAAFTLGELGNYWCHAELRRLREEKQSLAAAGAPGKYVIPSRGPFGWIACPHYSFELLSWAGYAALNGGDATSAFLIVSSICAMGKFAKEKHDRYVKIYKEGDRGHGDPSKLWIMIPGLW